MAAQDCYNCKLWRVLRRTQELCEKRGGRPGLLSLIVRRVSGRKATPKKKGGAGVRVC